MFLKPISKEYLIFSLKDFNEKVLSKIYAKISSIKEIKESLKDDIRKGYQQILNEEIEYCFATLSQASTLYKNTIYHFDNIGGNKMELTDDDNVRLKAGKLYCIEADVNISEITASTGSSASFYICDQDSNAISKNFTVSTMKATGIISDCIEIPNTFIKPEVDINLAIRSGSVVGSASKIVKAYLSVFEIKQPVYTNVNVASYADQVGHGEDTPVGQVISFMGTTTPENYLACDGAIYNIADCPDLSTFINTQFGSYNHFGGDDINTFAVPDLREEFFLSGE